MKDNELDIFVRGLQVVMQTEGLQMKPLSEQAKLGETAVKDLFRYKSSPRISTALALAKAVGRSLDEIVAIGEAGVATARPKPTAQPGFSEPTVAEYQYQEQPIPENEPRPALRRVFGTAARTLAEHWLTEAIPAFHLLAGDVIVVDLALTPKPGQLCIASRETGIRDKELIVGRFWGDWLDLGDTSLNGAPIRTDAPGITARNPIIGVLRGLPPPAKGKP